MRLQSNYSDEFYRNYSPFIRDMLVRILIIIMIIYGLQGKLVGVGTALLYGDIEAEVYMDCLEGIVSAKEDEALLFQSTIYRFVQSTRQYYMLKPWTIPTIVEYHYPGLQGTDNWTNKHNQLTSQMTKLVTRGIHAYWVTLLIPKCTGPTNYYARLRILHNPYQ